MNFRKNLLEEKEESSHEDFQLDVLEGENEDFIERFITYCVDNAIPQEHAQAFIAFIQEEQNAIVDNACSSSEQELKSIWGTRYNQQIHKARKALLTLDRKLGGKLIPFFESGYGNMPLLIQMLAQVGSMIDEDNIGLPATGAYSDKAMSTEEFLNKVVFKQ